MWAPWKRGVYICAGLVQMEDPWVPTEASLQRQLPEGLNFRGKAPQFVSKMGNRGLPRSRSVSGLRQVSHLGHRSLDLSG